MTGDAMFPEAGVLLACVPGAIPASDRKSHLALTARLFLTRAHEPWDPPWGGEGYVFHFGAADFESLTEWIRNERSCCPFLTFVLELAPGAGPVTMRLGGPAGTRQILDAALLSR